MYVSITRAHNVSDVPIHSLVKAVNTGFQSGLKLHAASSSPGTVVEVESLTFGGRKGSAKIERITKMAHIREENEMKKENAANCNSESANLIAAL
jgi:hypothetical protein